MGLRGFEPLTPSASVTLTVLRLHRTKTYGIIPALRNYRSLRAGGRVSLADCIIPRPLLIKYAFRTLKEYDPHT